MDSRYDRPPVELGDSRQSISGDELTWTKEGWKVV